MACSTKPEKLTGGVFRDSCFTNTSLRKIATTFNSENPTSRKRIPDDVIRKGSREELVRAVREAFSAKCSTRMLPHHHDGCILQTAEGKRAELSPDEREAPPPPAPDNKLLVDKPWNTFEVISAMEFVEKRFPSFMFLETVPIDFDERNKVGQCVVSELCRFDIREVVRNGKTSFGVVFNTHPSYRRGGHWVCCFGCLKTGRICYYDSYGFLPESQILTFMKRVAGQYQRLFGKEMNLLYNDYQNQHKNVECGTFCILFLSEMAEHGDMSRAVRSIKDDDVARSRRVLLFSPAIDTEIRSVKSH